MSRLYDWPWVQKQTEQTLAIWNSCASTPASIGPRYSPAQRREREKAYDEALQAVELELRNAPRLRSERLATQARITAVFAHFSALALGLEDNATHILTDEFLPVGSTLARWARRFDPDLSMPDIIQACRNAWTACGMQPLLGEQVRLTSSILGYVLQVVAQLKQDAPLEGELVFLFGEPAACKACVGEDGCAAFGAAQA